MLLQFYRHTDQEKFNEAKGLVVNLAQTVIGDLQQQQQQQQQTQQQHHQLPLFEHPPPHQPNIPISK